MPPLPEMQFAFINYADENSANNLLSSYMHDKDIEILIDTSNKKPNFIFYAQSRKVRNGYLRM